MTALLWDRPILCLVVDRATCLLPAADAVREAVRGGVDWVQIRERELEGGELLAWSESLTRAAIEGASDGGHAVAVVVNKRVDIALALARYEAVRGVHLGFDAVAPPDARGLLGAGAWIGVSTHSPDEVAQLARSGSSRSGASRSGPSGSGEVSYAHLAPIFSPLSKAASRPPLGLAMLAQASRSGLAVLAQGGIEPGNARLAVDAGAAGIAVTGSILQSRDPRAAARSLRAALDGRATS
jgi:thiamine-phosphate pyrophosphorylase